MALILCLETATRVCSVTLSRGNELVAMRESEIPNVHSSSLTIFVESLFRDSGLSIKELDAIAVSMGPGSYTGLRIGVATAKGFCYALDRPLIAVPTLQAMSVGMEEWGMKNAKCKMQSAEFKMQKLVGEERTAEVYCPMIDARRMEVYTGLYGSGGVEIREVRAEIIDAHSFMEILENSFVIFGGDGAEKCKPILQHHRNALFADDFKVSARQMIKLAHQRFDAKSFENLAYFEPFYLKDFVAGKPNVKGLR